MPCHRTCTHLKGHGGHKQSVRQVHNWLRGGTYGFVGKTDIRGYYARINKHLLLEQLARFHLAAPGKTFIGKVDRGFDWLGSQ